MSVSLSTALNADVLRSYGGAIQGTDSHGLMDIEFKNMHSAASWAEAMDISDMVRARNAFPEDNGKFFSARVVVQIRAASVTMREKLDIRNIRLYLVNWLGITDAAASNYIAAAIAVWQDFHHNVGTCIYVAGELTGRLKCEEIAGRLVFDYITIYDNDF